MKILLTDHSWEKLRNTVDKKYHVIFVCSPDLSSRDQAEILRDCLKHKVIYNEDNVLSSVRLPKKVRKAIYALAMCSWTDEDMAIVDTETLETLKVKASK